MTRRRRRRRGEHAQAHQRHHPDVGADGARRARINLARLDGMVQDDAEHEPAGAHVRSIDAARAQMATEGDELWRGAIELADWARARDRRAPRRALPRRRGPRRGTASPRSTPPGSRSPRCDLGHTGYRARDRSCATTTASPSRPPTRSTSCSTSPTATRGTTSSGWSPRSRTTPRASPAGPAPAAGRPGRRSSATRRPSRGRCSRRATRSSPPSAALPLAECAGRVSAEIVTPYPPGIPVLGPGEVISDEIVAYLPEARPTASRSTAPRTARWARCASSRLRRPFERSRASRRPTRGPEESRTAGEDSSANPRLRGGTVHRAQDPGLVLALAGLTLTAAACSASGSTGGSATPSSSAGKTYTNAQYRLQHHARPRVHAGQRRPMATSSGSSASSTSPSPTPTARRSAAATSTASGLGLQARRARSSQRDPQAQDGVQRSRAASSWRPRRRQDACSPCA